MAVKRTLPHLAGDRGLVARFEREARLAAVLTHRHIVQVFDFGRADGAAWLAMEYVHGVDLKAVQDRWGANPLPTGLAVEIGLACARGLYHAHCATDAKGAPLDLIHRDVSPQNVLISFDGDVKVTDFGLAAVASETDGTVQGKLAYMSPEQAHGAALDARTDQFSLGVVLYECLSGERAFAGPAGEPPAPLGLLDRVRGGRPARPLAAFAVHPALAAVVERAMAVEPAARFPDLAALADALRAAARNAGVSVGEPSLSGWLRALFPERTGPAAQPTETVVNEPTAAAADPIVALEVTLDAVAPAILPGPPAASPAGPAPGEKSGPNGPLLTHGSPEGRRATAPETPPGGLTGVGPGATGARRGRRSPGRAAAAAMLTVGAGAGLVFLLLRPHGDAPAPGDVTPASAAPAPASAVPSTAPAPQPVLDPPAPPPGSAGSAGFAAPGSAGLAGSAGSAGIVAPSAPAPAPPRPASSASSATTAPARPPPSEAPRRPASEPPAPAPPTASPPPGSVPAPPTVAAVAAPPPSAASAPAPASATPAAGLVPRVRCVAAGGAVARDAASTPLEGWRPLDGRSLLVKVTGGPGPPVSVRLLPAGRGVRANITADPYGDVRLDGVELGGTPVVDLPLRAGTRRLVVRGPNATETQLGIEVSPAEEVP